MTTLPDPVALTAIDGPRACRPAELPAAIALVDSIMRARSTRSMRTDYPLVYADANLPHVTILKVGDQIVSEVPFIPRPVAHAGCKFTIGIISPTCTHPDHRQRGHAMGCLQHDLALMAAANIELSVLWTMVPTFRFYEQAGYQAVAPQAWEYPCTRADADQFRAADRWHIRPAHPHSDTDLHAIQQLHDADAPGVLRTLPEARQLFSLAGLTTWLAYATPSATPAAYLTVSTAPHKLGIIEGAASQNPDALRALLHHALAALPPDQSVTAHAPLAANTLGRLLHTHLPTHRQPTTKHMMIRINDPLGFGQALHPWLHTHPHASHLAAHLVPHPPTTASARRPLAAALFSPHPQHPLPTAPAPSLSPPLHFPLWLLDHS